MKKKKSNVDDETNPKKQKRTRWKNPETVSLIDGYIYYNTSPDYEELRKSGVYIYYYYLFTCRNLATNPKKQLKKRQKILDLLD
jgi:hypothetical protein